MRAVCPNLLPTRQNMHCPRIRCAQRNVRALKGWARPKHALQRHQVTAALPQNDVELDNHDDFGSTEFPELTPDTVTMWNEIHSNIVELNRSRLKALQELKYARNRLNELELQLADRDAKIIDLERALENQWHDGGSLKPLNGASKKSLETKMESKDDAKAATNLNGNGKAASPAKTGITIKYYTGWDPCFIHFNADGKGWTTCPGEKLDAEKGENNCKVRVINAKTMEFVLNNGSNGWDKPPPGSDKPNYTITEPGVYVLRNGKVEKAK